MVSLVTSREDEEVACLNNNYSNVIPVVGPEGSTGKTLQTAD